MSRTASVKRRWLTEKEARSVRHCRKVVFQLVELEARREIGLLRFRRKNGVGLVDAFIPPIPGAFLRVAPREHRHSAGIVSNGHDGVPIGSQGAGRPWPARIEILQAVLLDLEAEIDAAEEL